jgi:hypothetical protein
MWAAGGGRRAAGGGRGLRAAGAGAGQDKFLLRGARTWLRAWVPACRLANGSKALPGSLSTSLCLCLGVCGAQAPARAAAAAQCALKRSRSSALTTLPVLPTCPARPRSLHHTHTHPTPSIKGYVQRMQDPARSS